MMESFFSNFNEFVSVVLQISEQCNTIVVCDLARSGRKYRLVYDMLSWRRPIEPGKHKPVFLEIRSSTWFISVTVCTIVFTDIFLYGVIVPVLPFALHERANIADEDVQHWISVLFAIYGGAMTIGSPVCGFLADRFTSRRLPLLLGLFALAGSTLLICLGRSIAVLLVGRLFQGLSAAMSWTVALALLSDSLKKEGIGQALGYVGFSYSMGVLIAPLLGGIVYQRGGYFAVFGMTFGVIGLDIILRLVLIEKKVAQKWQLNETSLLEPLGDAETKHNVDVQLQVLQNERPLPVSQTIPPAEIHQQSRRKLPPILILLKSSRILAAVWGNFVASTVLCGFDATIPLFVKDLFHWNSVGAGLIFLAILVPSAFGPFTGHLTDKYGASLISTIGFITAVPFLILLRLVDHEGIRQVVLFCALLTGVGISMSLVLTSLITEFSKVCDDLENTDPSIFASKSAYAQSYGVYNVAWGAGALIGPLWAGGIESRGGWGTMTLSLGLLCAVSVPPVMVYIDRPVIRKLTTPPPEITRTFKS